MKELELTVKEWQIVNEQCSKCQLWTDDGCSFEQHGIVEPHPVPDCQQYVERY